MNSKTNRSSFLYGILFLQALLLVMPSMASAEWWRFGTDAAEPVFTDILFNQVSVINADKSVHFTRDDLDSERVIVRGRAEIGQGKVGRIEATLDGGVTWQEISFNDRGLFAFEFKPELEKDYRFRIRALSTTGRASDDMAHSFEFRVVRTNNRELVIQAFNELINRYIARDRSGFMALVSDDFIGNPSALDSALSNDFRYFDAIRIRPTVQRVADMGGRWSVYFSFQRQLRSIRSGKLLQDQASTSLVLTRGDDGYRLSELAAPLIFGVSDPVNVATSVTQESIGQKVIVVDADGVAQVVEQGQDTTPDTGTGPGPGGTPTLPVHSSQLTATGHPPAGYNFATGTQTPMTGDIIFHNGDEITGVYVELGTGVTARDMGMVGIENIAEVPASGFSSTMPSTGWILPGRTYAFRLATGRYSLFEITNIYVVGHYVIIDFDFKYQPDGSRSF